MISIKKMDSTHILEPYSQDPKIIAWWYIPEAHWKEPQNRTSSWILGCELQKGRRISGTSGKLAR